jgi:hypothetical protein
MPEPEMRSILDAVRPDPGRDVETPESLAARLPGFSPEAVAEAMRMLCLSGVLEEVTREDGTVGYRYAHPERYRLAGTSDVKQPEPDFGKR